MHGGEHALPGEICQVVSLSVRFDLLTERLTDSFHNDVDQLAGDDDGLCQLLAVHGGYNLCVG